MQPMRNKKTLFALVLALVVFIMGIAASVFISVFDISEENTISLPEKTDDTISSEEEIREQNNRVFTAVTVDASNVKSLIERLERPYEYSFRTDGIIVSGGYSLTVSTEGYVKGEFSKTVEYEGENPISHMVMTPQSIYAWKNGANEYETLGRGDFTYDDVSYMPTYEELLEGKEITEASLKNIGGDLFVFVKAQNEATKLTEEYTVSVSKGLPVSAVFKKDDSTVMSVNVENIEVGEVDTSVFLLPDGKNPITE